MPGMDRTATLSLLGEAPAPGATSDPARRAARLSRTMLATVGAYGLIEAGDRILVAVSGGKDSATLLDLLARARRKAPVDFELVALHLDQGQPGYDGAPLAAWLASLGVPFEIARLQKDFPVTLYTTPNCGEPCALARTALNRRSIPFTEEQVWNEETAEKLKSLSGSAQLPVLVVGRSVLSGYEPGQFDALLDSAGYPAAGSYPAAAA